MENPNISNFIFINEAIEMGVNKERQFCYIFLLKTIMREKMV